MAEWWQEVFGAGRYTVLEGLPEDHSRAQARFVVERLGLRPGERVLDVACGVGRHARPLAAAGLRVVGFDYSMDYVRQARAAASDDGADRPAFVRADMRRVPLASGAFDAACALFNSFGYFDDAADDARALAEVARVLRPGGGLLIDVLHRDGMARGFTADRAEDMPDGTRLSERRRWDAADGRIRSRWTFAGGESRRESFDTAARVFTLGELRRLLDAAGFDVGGAWGGWDGRPLGVDDTTMIVAARHRASQIAGGCQPPAVGGSLAREVISPAE